MTSVHLHPDRRSHRRAPLDRPVLVDVPSSSRPVRALDVSGSGLSLVTGDEDLDFELGSIVEVYFELPIGYAVEARAQVVRRDSGVTALRFLDLDREAEVALRSYCRISGLHQLELQV